MWGDGFTCVTVTEIPSRSGSRISHRTKICDSAWRNISPTRNWRCDGPLEDEVEWRRDIVRNAARLERALDGFDLERLDHIALLHVLVIRERHAAFLAILH